MFLNYKHVVWRWVCEDFGGTRRSRVIKVDPKKYGKIKKKQTKDLWLNPIYTVEPPAEPGISIGSYKLSRLRLIPNAFIYGPAFGL